MKYKAEAFVDVFNAMNRQSPISIEETAQGASGYSFGEPLTFQTPRRVYVGAKISF